VRYGTDGCCDQPLSAGNRNAGRAAEPGSTSLFWPEMRDVIKAVVPQKAFDLVGDKETHEGFAHFRRDRFERTGHLESNVIQHTVRLVVGKRDLATRHALRDRPNVASMASRVRYMVTPIQENTAGRAKLNPALTRPSRRV